MKNSYAVLIMLSTVLMSKMLTKWSWGQLLTSWCQVTSEGCWIWKCMMLSRLSSNI